jgi:hypothetical protein
MNVQQQDVGNSALTKLTVTDTPQHRQSSETTPISRQHTSLVHVQFRTLNMPGLLHGERLIVQNSFQRIFITLRNQDKFAFSWLFEKINGLISATTVQHRPGKAKN